MENNVKFSVLIPAYKEEYLKECVGSILQQSYSNFEVIIVNDASPYDLEKQLCGFCDNRIRYYRNETGCGGLDVVDNWNKALSYCKGDYVICMGDDDKLLPECFSLYYKAISEYPEYKVFHIRTQMINEKSDIIDVQDGRPEIESKYSFLWHDLMGYRKQFIGDFLFEINALRENGGFFKLPWAWSSDRISVLFAAGSIGIRNINEYGFQYRINSQSISVNIANTEGKIQAYRETERIYNEIANETPDNQDDEIYCQMIRRILRKAINKRITNLISQDIATSRKRILLWIRKKNVYFYSSKDIVKAFVLSCALRK